jgi:hypothetical protein
MDADQSPLLYHVITIPTLLYKWPQNKNPFGSDNYMEKFLQFGSIRDTIP